MKIFSDNKVYLFDGAMGTQLMKKGVPAGICFEELNISDPELIEQISREYVEAGADIIETNTFGATKIKLSSYGLEDKFYKINFDAVRIAKKASKGNALVAASMGPCGQMLEPIGDFTFDQAYEEFSSQAKVFEEAGADLISIETMSDLQEARAALIAVKQNTSLPVIVHLTYDKTGKTNTGTPPEVAINVLTHLGADAIGANCSTGPVDMINLAKKFSKGSIIPVSIMPNAGNPEIIDDETVYKMAPQDFAYYMKKILSYGIKFVGGCCGTTPAHIKELRNVLNKSNYIYKPKKITKEFVTILSSRSKTIEIGKSKKVIIIGERINPTNKKEFQNELKEGKMNILRQEATSQVAAGADMLDVNVGIPDIDEPLTMKKAILSIQLAVDVPLCIDSSNPYAIEEGLKNFPGRALINSVNAKEESLQKILPLAKKYGAAIIALCLEDKILEKAEDRIEIAKKIIQRASDIGLEKNDIFVDVLTLSAGAQQEAVKETLKALALCKSKLKIKTILGISNVSHGLPNRKVLNAAFLKIASSKGLTAAIYNPENLVVKPSLEEFKDAYEVFFNLDKNAQNWIKKYSSQKSTKYEDAKKKDTQLRKNFSELVYEAVIDGNKESIIRFVEESLKENSPQKIIDEFLLPAMEEVGKRFSKGVYFIPQVMASAETMKLAFERLKKEIKPTDRKNLGTVVIATVLGDIHDIGKNIVAMLLENHGFNVIDLGKDVPPSEIVRAVKENNASIVMLSALLTTTMPQMKIVKQELEKAGISVPVMVGGAPVTENFAKGFGANFAKDAIEAVEKAKKLLRSF